MHLYALIRIPKSGSRSLETMVRSGLRGSTIFPLSNLGSKTGTSWVNNIRIRRNRLQSYLRYGALTEKGVWRTISSKAKSGDVISAHMAYGAPQLPEWDLKYITLLRNPTERIVSNYHYNRLTYQNLPAFRKMYRKGLHEIVGTRSLTEFLQYLHDENKKYRNSAIRYVTGDSDHENPFEFLKENYFHFGVLDHIDIFAKQFGEKTGRKVNLVWENRTSSKNYYKLSDTDKELIDTIFSKDIELYNKVKEYVLSNG